MPRRRATRSRLMISFASLTGVGIVHGSGRRRARWRMMRRLLRRYPEGGEERSGHRARGGARRRRALLAYEQARGREPEELGSLEPRPIVAGQVRSLRRDLHGHRDACRYHTCNRIRDAAGLSALTEREREREREREGEERLSGVGTVSVHSGGYHLWNTRSDKRGGRGRVGGGGRENDRSLIARNAAEVKPELKTNEHIYPGGRRGSGQRGSARRRETLRPSPSQRW